MESLPDEMIHLIFDNIKVTNDKRKFLRTCNKYYDMFKIFRSNIKYAVFYIIHPNGAYGQITFTLDGIFDDLNKCREYIKLFMLELAEYYPPRDNNYTMISSTHDVLNKRVNIDTSDLFLIEERELNKFSKI